MIDNMQPLFEVGHALTSTNPFHYSNPIVNHFFFFLKDCENKQLSQGHPSHV